MCMTPLCGMFPPFASLQPSLQGNARVAIICTIAVATNYFEETNNTLKFASRAKKVIST